MDDDDNHQRLYGYGDDDGDMGDWWQRPQRAYRSFGPFRLVSTAMIAVAIGLVVLGLACAVMFVSDMAEEHPTTARWVLRCLIAFNVIVHTAILVVDQISWWRSVISLVVNVLYMRLMHTFPFVPGMSSPIVLATIFAVVLESAMWYWMAVRLMYYTSILLIIGFFVLLWLVPVGLLTSCVVEDDRLPGGGSAGFGAAAPASTSADATGRRKRTILNRLADLINKGV